MQGPNNDQILTTDHFQIKFKFQELKTYFSNVREKRRHSQR